MHNYYVRPHLVVVVEFNAFVKWSHLQHICAVNSLGLFLNVFNWNYMAIAFVFCFVRHGQNKRLRQRTLCIRTAFCCAEL